VDLYERLVPAASATAPGAGYLIPAAQVPVVKPKLALHGLRFEAIPAARAASVLAFRAEAVKLAAAPYEGRVGAELTGAWRPERRDVPAGSLFVPIDQPGAPLLLQLFEPTSNESLAAWGFFHAAFEQKEYMEHYIAEEEARSMLARDPKLRREFEAALAKDPAMAKSPSARLKFFYRRHPAWDERVNLYPILRLDRRP
jgi:plasmid stabilization system protein ParE